MEHIFLPLGALVVVVEVDLFHVRGLGDRRVVQLPSGVRELVVEDRDGLVNVAFVGRSSRPRSSCVRSSS